MGRAPMEVRPAAAMLTDHAIPEPSPQGPTPSRPWLLLSLPRFGHGSRTSAEPKGDRPEAARRAAERVDRTRGGRSSWSSRCRCRGAQPVLLQHLFYVLGEAAAFSGRRQPQACRDGLRSARLASPFQGRRAVRVPAACEKFDAAAHGRSHGCSAALIKFHEVSRGSRPNTPGERRHLAAGLAGASPLPPPTLTLARGAVRPLESSPAWSPDGRRCSSGRRWLPAVFFSPRPGTTSPHLLRDAKSIKLTSRSVAPPLDSQDGFADRLPRRRGVPPRLAMSPPRRGRTSSAGSKTSSRSWWCYRARRLGNGSAGGEVHGEAGAAGVLESTHARSREGREDRRFGGRGGSAAAVVATGGRGARGWRDRMTARGSPVALGAVESARSLPRKYDNGGRCPRRQRRRRRRRCGAAVERAAGVLRHCGGGRAAKTAGIPTPRHGFDGAPHVPDWWTTRLIRSSVMLAAGKSICRLCMHVCSFDRRAARRPLELGGGPSGRWEGRTRNWQSKMG
ncbi:hypothetical protein ZWY2020_000422 [Hordeum vulgare]|nr:hypothetical protein ZWY2020_000422 [Hordeum vulgare]